jgi:hypothetical protein
MKRSAMFILLGVFLPCMAGGCNSLKQEFVGYDPGHVWSVMRAVAESPEYDDWYVVTNDVWTSPEEARMEVYRELQRYHRTPLSRPRMERRSWRIRIVMLDTTTPTANFISRDWSTPGHTREEAERFYADVFELLGPPGYVRPREGLGPLRRHPNEGYSPRQRERPDTSDEPAEAPEMLDAPTADADDGSSNG